MSLVTRLCENKPLMYSVITVLVISIVALGYLAWKKSSSTTQKETETPDIDELENDEVKSEAEVESEEELVEQGEVGEEGEEGEED